MKEFERICGREKIKAGRVKWEEMLPAVADTLKINAGAGVKKAIAPLGDLNSSKGMSSEIT